MSRYAAFLYGVNVGKHKRASGADLRAAFEDLGLGDVATFRTSGNVVFTAGRQTPAALKQQVDKGLTAALGFDVVVFLRSARELVALAAEQPFSAKQVAASKGKLQVMLLGAKPAAKAKREVLALASDQDLLAFGPRELFWLPSGGTLESELDRDAIARLLGQATTRTMGTIEALAGKYFAD